MTLSEYALAGASWAAVVLIQVTLIALVGLLAWLAARRCGPALRGACLLAGLIGVLLTPVLALMAPVWLPLPECLCPVKAPSLASDSSPAPALVLRSGETNRLEAEFVVVLTPPPLKAPLIPEDPTGQGDETKPAKATPAVLNLSLQPQEVDGLVRLASPTPVSRPERSPIAGLLAALWLLGALVCLVRALVRLALLYRVARKARPVCDAEWIGCAAALAQRHGLPAVELRESSAIGSPLTLGLFRPIILLPTGRRDWSNEQRELILGHELAHVRRRDFLAGLLAEVVLCLCWFHPLVRWLADRLRLEQEFAADAWVASAASDSTEYVRCLARLALEQGRGRSSLAPALWRRRPEILRRIDMLRRSPAGLPSRLGKRTAWTVAALAAAVCLAIAGVGPLQSADGPKGEDKPQKAQAKDADPQGDPLPAGALARLGTTRLRHGADVTFVAFGADGKTLITAGQDGTIRLWDLENRKEVRRFTRPRPAAPKPLKQDDKKMKAEAFMQVMMAGGGGESETFGVALSPDGKTLAAAAAGVVQLWEVESGKELRQLEGAPSGLAGLVYSPDGKTLAGRTATGGLFLWSADTGKQLHHIKPSRRQNEDGLVFVIGGGSPDSVGITFTPDSKALVAAVTDYNKNEAVNSIEFWDIATGKVLRKIKPPEGGLASVLALAPGGKILASGVGNTVHLCEADTGKAIRQIKPASGGIQALVFSPDGKTLAVRGRNQRVRLWETETGKELHQLSDAEPPQRSGGGFLFVANGISGPERRVLAMSPDGKRVASTAGSTVRLWETASGKELPLIEGHWRAPTAIVLSPDGKTAVTWGFDRVVRRWEATTGKSLGSFPAPARTTLAIFSADGKTIAFAIADNTIRIHDTATGKELQKLKGHPNGAIALAFAPGDKVLASRGGDNSIKLHDVARGVELRQLVVRPGQQAAGDGNFILVLGGGSRGSRGTGPGLVFSPDGQLVVVPVSGGNEKSNTLVFFDAASGKELRKIESPQGIASFAFSPDGRSIAAENADRSITVWEVAGGKERFHLGKVPDPKPQGRDGGVGLNIVLDGIGSGGISEASGDPVGVSFSPDGRALIVRGADRSVRIWDITAGKEIGQLKGHTGRIETVAFAPNGKTLASGSADTTVLVWDAARVLKDLSKQRETQLSPAELRRIWDELAGEDAAKAYQGVRGLASAHGQAVTFLGTRLKPAARIDPEKIKGWIADLSSTKFTARQEAAVRLLKVGEQAVPALQKELAAAPELETRKRVEDLLNRLTGGVLTADQLRMVRAVEALELMATPEARKVLRTLAGGAPGALTTREAEAALVRSQKSEVRGQ